MANDESLEVSGDSYVEYKEKDIDPQQQYVLCSIVLNKISKAINYLRRKLSKGALLKYCMNLLTSTACHEITNKRLNFDFNCIRATRKGERTRCEITYGTVDAAIREVHEGTEDKSAEVIPEGTPY